MGKEALQLGEILTEADKRRMQVYVDDGHGFSEEQSFFIDQGYDQKVSCTISIPEGALRIWIDPALSACMLKDVKLRWKEDTGGNAQAVGSQRDKNTVKSLPVKYTTTGFEIEKNCFLFDNSDPKIIIEEIPGRKCQIDVSYQISILEEQTAAMLMEKVNTKGRMKKKVRGLLRR